MRMFPFNPAGPDRGYSTVAGLNFKLFLRVDKDFAKAGLPADKDTGLPERRAYLDHNATSPVRDEVRQAVAEALGLTGNPSSIHAEGRAAKAAIESARAEVAALAGVKAQDVVFTSGGTEAAAQVLTPSLTGPQRQRPEWLIVSASEHACVRDGHRFAPDRVVVVPVDCNGVVQPDALEDVLVQAGQPALVSIHLANNETGVVQPIAELAAATCRHGGLIHSDAVQAAGRIPLAAFDLGVHALTLSAHKLGGPKGVGALIVPGDSLGFGDRLIRGGGQERGHRAGTENLPGIIGFGVAARLARLALDAEMPRLLMLRERFEAGLRAIGPVTIFGEGASRLPNTCCFAFPGVRSESAMILLDLAGVSVSSGAACSSGKVRRSHVLDAMGVAPELAECALRASLGWSSTDDDIEQALAIVAQLWSQANRKRAAA